MGGTHRSEDLNKMHDGKPPKINIVPLPGLHIPGLF
jgi:hypothetical protein